jgi:hypothetical protein
VDEVQDASFVGSHNKVRTNLAAFCMLLCAFGYVGELQCTFLVCAAGSCKCLVVIEVQNASIVYQP